MWIVWLILSNAGIFWLEYLYRSGKYPNFVVALPEILLPVLVSQMGLFYAFRQAPSLFICGSVFTLMNIALRLVNNHRLGETLNNYNIAGIALLVVSVILIKKP